MVRTAFKNIILLFSALLLISSVSAQEQKYVILQVDVQTEQDLRLLDSVLKPIEDRGWIVTVYMTDEMLRVHPEIVADVHERGHQIAILGSDNLLSYSLDGKVESLNSTLNILRGILAPADAGRLHYKSVSYESSYTDIISLLDALRILGVSSETGFHPVDSGFKCEYCARRGRIVYPIEFDRITVVPIAEAKTLFGEVPLDDKVILGNLGFTPEDFLQFLKAEVDQKEIKEPRAVVVHPSITGSNYERLSALDSFLQYVEDSGGRVVLTEKSVAANTIAAGYHISYLSASGPSSAAPGDSVMISYTYTTTFYCPTFYFRAYGKYPSESDWRMLYSASFYHNLATYTRTFSTDIPEPPQQTDDAYTVRVVGRSCNSGFACWPTVNSYEKMDEVEITVGEPDLNVTDKDITLSKPAKRSDPITVTVTVRNEGNVTARNVNVKISKKAPFGAYGAETKTIASIAAHGSAQTTISWYGTWRGGENDPDFLDVIKVQVDPDNNIRELKENNNDAESHRICGTVKKNDASGFANVNVRYEQQNDAAAWIYHMDTFTDKQGDYCFSTNMEFMVEDKQFRTLSLVKWSPDRDMEKIVFEMYDDSQWGAAFAKAANAIAYWATGNSGTLKKDADFLGRDITYAAHDSISALERLIGIYNYFKNRNMETKETIFVEVNNNDNAACDGVPTSCALIPHITMWHDRDTTDDVEHEYGHHISQTGNWKNKYEPVEENWASYASCIARGSTHYNNWGWDLDISNVEDTDGDNVTNSHEYRGPVWDFQLCGVYNEFGADSTINALKRGNLQTAENVYNAYRTANSASLATSYQYKTIFRRHGFDPWWWWPWGAGSSPPLKSVASVSGFTGTFSDSRVDSNSDGIGEALNVTAQVNVTAAANYTFSGFLYDGRNSSYCYASSDLSLTTGVQSLSLLFSGTCIYNNMLNGTLQLTQAYLDYQNGTNSAAFTSGYNTSAYNYTGFSYPSVFYTGVESDTGVDNNSNAKYDLLAMYVGLNVSMQGNYSVQGILYDSTGNITDSTSTQVYSASGILNVSLNFSGQAIRAGGVNGPYNASLTVYDISNGSLEIYSYLQRIQTSSYSYTDFDSNNVGFNSNITAYAIDANNNSLYDYLILNLSVNTTVGEEYTLLGAITNSSGDVIATSDNITNSSLTVQQLQLSFKCKDIRNATLNGPYNITLQLKDGYVLTSLGSSTVARYVYSTSSYNYTQFDAYAAEFLSVNYSSALSNLVSSKYQYLNVTLNFTSVLSDTYSFEGRLYSSAGTLLARASTSSSASATLRSIQLGFGGGDIYAGGTSGPYNLTLLVSDGNNNLVAEYGSVHITSNYSYTQFSPHDSYPNGTYANSGSDSNGDGFFDYLNVDVALTIDLSGYYYLTALVSDENGTGVATAANHSYISAGTSWVRLPFDGLTIREEGKNTYYALARLTMYVNSSGETVELYNRYNTSSYNYTQFNPGGSIYGRITYANGSGMNYSLVTASGSATKTAYTNASGDYNITGLVTSTYTVTAHPPSGGNLRRNSTSVYVNGTRASNANLSLLQGATVTGSIVDEDGSPAANVSVSVFGASTVYGSSSANGSYTITGLAEGNNNITVTPSASANLNWSSNNFTVSVGQTVTVNFTLEKKGSVSGYVFDYNGNPVPYPMLHTLYYFLGSTSEDPKFAGEANGSFLLTGLDNDTYPYYPNAANNTYNIQVNPPAGLELLNITESVYVIPGQTAYRNFTLPRSGRVVGYVFDQYGDPVVGANLSLKSGSTTLSSATAGSAGNYSLTQLNNGTYTVQLDYPTTPTQWLIFVDGVYQAYDTSVQITGTANQTVYVNFTLQVPAGDWRTQGIVYGSANCTSETVTMAGGILATSGNSLTAVNCTIVFNGTSDGQYGITVENGAVMNFTNSTIRSSNSSIAYTFKAMPGSALTIRDSTVSSVGYGALSYSGYGIYVSSGNAVIERNNISGNYYGVVLYYANNSQVSNNTIGDSYYDGIYAYYSNNNTIRYNTIRNSSNNDGISIYAGNNNTIQNNIVENSSQNGIYVYSGQWNNVSNNTLRYNGRGIYLSSADYTDASFNTIENSDADGMYVYADHATLLNNTVRNSGTYGIYIYYSSLGALSYNAIEDSGSAGLFIESYSSSEYNHTIDRFNTVNGKQVRYYYGQSNQVLQGRYVGHLGIAFSSNITFTNNNLTDADGVIIYRNSYNNTISNSDISNSQLGVRIIYSGYSTVFSNNIRNSSLDGVYLYYSNSSNISGNNISMSAEDGIDSDNSLDNTLAGNRVEHSRYAGINLYSSANNRLENNTVYNSTMEGVYLYYSNNNNLTANTVYNNTEEGAYLYASVNCNLSGNNFSKNDWNLRLDGGSFAYYNHSIGTSNTVNGHPVYYYFNTSGVTLNSVTAGQIAFAYSDLNTVTGNVIADGDGIIFYYSSGNNTILNNNVTWSEYGLYLYSSNYNNVSGNFLCGSESYDLLMSYGTGNSGDDNTCTLRSGWSDVGTSYSCTSNCSGYTTTTTTSSTTTTINATTTTSLPYVVQVSLEQPANSLTDYDGNLFIKYRASQKASVVNCSLYTNMSGAWAVTNTTVSVLNNQVNGFYLADMANGTFRWNVLCADLWENERFAASDRILTVNRTSSDTVNTQLNLTVNETGRVNLTSGTNVTLDMVMNSTISNGRVMVTSSRNSTTNGTFSVPSLNRFISIDASPEVTNSLSWAYLRVYYSEAEVNASSMNETDLALYWYNESLGNWQELTTNLSWVYAEGVNTTADYLYANLTHFSEYTLAQSNIQTTNLISIPLTAGWNLISTPLNT